jgi:hypothetical protein
MVDLEPPRHGHVTRDATVITVREESVAAGVTLVKDRSQKAVSC